MPTAEDTKNKLSSDTEEDQMDPKSYKRNNTGATSLMAEISTSKEVTSSITKEATADHDNKSSDTNKDQPVFTSDNTTISKDKQLSTFPIKKSANRIMNINPKDDSFESVGEDLGNGTRKFIGTVADEDGIIYGIPDQSKQIIKIDPSNPDSTSNVGKEADEDFECGVYWEWMETSTVAMLKVIYW